MTVKEKADLRLNCLYAAISIMGVNSSALTMGEKEPRPTTEDVLAEAKKLNKYVLGK